MLKQETGHHKECVASMGFFGGTVREPERTAPQPIPDVLEDPVDDLPALEPAIDTIISKDIVVSGSLSGRGVAQVDGMIDGKVNLKGSLIVTATGRVKGPIEADVVQVAGCVQGNVCARSHLRLERSGTIEGDVSTVSFVIEDGGRLNGRSTMLQPPEEPVKIAPQPEPEHNAQEEEQTPSELV